jgi:hypothetical protein
MSDQRSLTFMLFLVLALLLVPMHSGYTSETKGAASIERISPEDTRSKVQAGKALLVCSYEDKKCKTMLLEGALLRSEFEEKIPILPKDQEIVFYCG